MERKDELIDHLFLSSLGWLTMGRAVQKLMLV